MSFSRITSERTHLSGLPGIAALGRGGSIPNAPNNGCALGGAAMHLFAAAESIRKAQYVVSATLPTPTPKETT